MRSAGLCCRSDCHAFGGCRPGGERQRHSRSGQSVLPQAKNTDIFLASLGVLLTAVYIYGLIFRPKRQFLNLGIDSLVVLVLYIIGVLGLFTITGGK
jgi:hypothetical protein